MKKCKGKKATYYNITSILVAKARALRDSFQLAIQGGFKNTVVEGDYNLVIQALKQKIQVPWQLSNIIEDIQIW